MGSSVKFIFLVSLVAMILSILLYGLLKLEESIFRQKSNKIFYLKNKGFFSKGYIMINYTKELKKAPYKQRGEMMISGMENLYSELPKGMVFKTTTHGIFKKRLEKAERFGKIKIINKRERLLPYPMILENLQIGNYDKLFELKKMYTIEFEAI